MTVEPHFQEIWRSVNQGFYIQLSWTSYIKVIGRQFYICPKYCTQVSLLRNFLEDEPHPTMVEWESAGGTDGERPAYLIIERDEDLDRVMAEW